MCSYVYVLVCVQEEMAKGGHLVASSLQGVECEEMAPPAMESCLCDTVSIEEEGIE